MEIKSKDLSALEAISMFEALTTSDEVDEFVAGDERKTVITAAEERRKVLAIPAGNEQPGASGSATAKQGEQAGPLTQPAADFKTGVQRTKGADDAAPPKTYVTCEDVIKKMRSEGKKI